MGLRCCPPSTPDPMALLGCVALVQSVSYHLLLEVAPSRDFFFNFYFFFLRPNRCYFLQREKCFSIIGAAFGIGVKI